MALYPAIVLLISAALYKDLNLMPAFTAEVALVVFGTESVTPASCSVIGHCSKVI